MDVTKSQTQWKQLSTAQHSTAQQSRELRSRKPRGVAKQKGRHREKVSPKGTEQDTMKSVPNPQI